MAKFYNNRIKSGKLAGSVFAVRYGEVIERAYNPFVANPKSAAQVEARAKLKLISQLSAVMAEVIAMPRIGNMSPRNRFVQRNYTLTSYANEIAEIVLAGVQLTASAMALPEISVTRGENVITANLRYGDANIGVSRIVYAMFVKDPDGKLRYETSRTATEAGQGQLWQVSFPALSQNVVILAYGVRDNSSTARVTFSDMQAISAETVAKLITSRVLTENDVTLTETRGFDLAAAQ